MQKRERGRRNEKSGRRMRNKKGGRRNADCGRRREEG
jgi:hypothetical protein